MRTSADLSLVPAVERMLCCPRCRGTVERQHDTFRCTLCSSKYPIVLGIPDFRLYEDRLIPLDDDYRKGEVLEAAAATRTFAELVAYYWTLPTYPDTPPDVSARAVHHVTTDAARIGGYADRLGRGKTFLDVGTGAGTLVRAMSDRFDLCVGADVGFRWLVVARRGLEEAGCAVNLVCCCADYLPFANGVFDSVASISMLEHVPDANAALAECSRVLAMDGGVFLWTPNRFSLAPEPHVRVCGVGFLPRRWMPAYVRWRRGIAYEKKHVLSRRELARGLDRAGLTWHRFVAPVVTAPDLQAMGRIERSLARIWAVVCRVPLLGRLSLGVFPVLQVVARRAPVQPAS